MRTAGPASTTALPERLRHETAAEHRALEARVDLDARLASTDTYASLLAALHPFHRLLEDLQGGRRGWDLLDPPVDLVARRKTHLLAADLRALGRRPAPGLPAAPSLRGFAGALGALYVTEGSTLGGAIVARRVAAQLGLGRDDGTAFFTSYGAGRGERWLALRRSLESFSAAASPTECDDVVHGARATFLALDDWLERTLG